MNGARPTRTTSIARRIAWSQQWRKFWRILFQTVVLFVVAVAVWCVATAQAADVPFGLGQEWYLQNGQDDYGLLTVPDVMLNVVLVDPGFALHLLQHGGDNPYADDVVFHMGDKTAEMEGSCSGWASRWSVSRRCGFCGGS